MTTSGQFEPAAQNVLIRRIKRLKRAAVFRDFKWPNELPDFAERNLVYGWNGSGKTTLSRILRSIEKRQAPNVELCELMLSPNTTLQLNEASGQRLPPIKVFNRDFVEDTIAADQFSSILVVADDAAEKLERVKQLRERQRVFDQASSDANRAVTKAGDAIKAFLTTEARRISKAMLDLGQSQYKAFHRDKLELLLSDDAKAEPQLGDPDSWRDTLKANAPKVYGNIRFARPDLAALLRRTREVCERSVVAQAIEELAKDEELRLWVESGFNLHKARHSSVCLYCGNAVPPATTRKLEAYFSAQVEALQTDLKVLLEEVDALEAAVKSAQASLPDSLDVLAGHRKKYKAALTSFTAECAEASKWTEEVGKVIRRRQRDPVNPVQLPALVSNAPVPPNISATTELLSKHDADVAEFTRTKQEACKALEAFEVAAVREEFVTLKTAEAEEAGYKAIVDRLRTRVKHSADALEREVSEHRRPAEEVTSELHAYLGRNDLSLIAKDVGYELQRNGEPAKAATLSEGEKTALALLFFLKSLEDKAFKDKRGIVVIDDPVSSLDSNALFSAVGFIRNRLKHAPGIAQLFVLTHNFSFFTECRKWGKKFWNMYMVESVGIGMQRVAVLRPVDPMIQRFDSEYHFLFKRVVDAAEAERLTWEEAYPLPNVGRRLMDAFLAFRVPTGDKLSEKLASAADTFCKDTIGRLERYLQLHSHNDWVPTAETDTSVLNGVHQAMKDVRDFIRATDQKHFDAVLVVVRGSK